MLTRQFSSRRPDFTRNPVPTLTLTTPALEPPIHLPHRHRDSRVIAGNRALRVQFGHKPTLSVTLTPGHAVLPETHVARQHCPPPLRRHAHPKTVPGLGTMNFQRTVNSV